MEALSFRVLDQKGKEVGSANLPASIFAAPVIEHAVYECVKWQLAKRRAGTHSALTRSMMDATGKKPFKQKGTGRARAGSSVSPLWVGGAVVHGPTPRKYGYKLPKSVRRAALLSVLTKKREDGQLTVVDGLSSSEGKTKEMIAVLNNMGLSGKSVLVVAGTKESSEDFLKLSRALRNVSGASLVKVAGLNVYDILKHTHLLIAKEALELLENRLKEE